MSSAKALSAGEMPGLRRQLIPVNDQPRVKRFLNAVAFAFGHEIRDACQRQIAAVPAGETFDVAEVLLAAHQDKQVQRFVEEAVLMSRVEMGPGCEPACSDGLVDRCRAFWECIAQCITGR